MSANSQFEALLKQSAHFADSMGSHREATAEVLTAFIGALIESGAMTPEKVLSVLNSLDRGSHRPSVDTSRRVLASLIRSRLQNMQ